MAPWTFNIEFSYDTQFIFRFLMFTVGDDENLELLTQGLAPRHLASVYGVSPYYPTDPSTSGGACLGLNPRVGSYYLSAMTSQGYPIEKTILQPSTGASSSTCSGATPNRDSTEDYLRLGAVLVGTLPSKPVALAWWAQLGAILRTTPVSTQS
jgi:hypothetical protein